MQISPYLGFDGRCEAALQFYAKCFGGRILTKVTYAETHMADQVPAEWRTKIIHARLKIGDIVLMGTDPIPDRYVAPKGFSLSLIVDSPAEAERIFSRLAENGTVGMPLQETFWATRFGMLVDQFGIQWMVNCEKKG